VESQVEIRLPKLGESIVSATIVRWLKGVGDRVYKDEALVEVATDKVNSEIPSPVAGVVTEIVAQIDQEVEVGELLARVSTAGGAAPTAAAERIVPQKQPGSSDTSSMATSLSPAVLRLAQQEGVSLEALQKIHGTGAGGRITRQDLETFIAARKSCPAAAAAKAATPKATPVVGDGQERVPMGPMRKAIADKMVQSFYQAPHASLITEIDVTGCMRTIERERDFFLKEHGVKLTLTTFFIQALATAVSQYPLINASLEDESTILLKRHVNVGIAVSVEKGILVPVIQQVEEKTRMSIARSLADLSQRARESRLAPDEVKNGTITLTNFGMSGVTMGIPIIHYPEVAILGMGAAQKKLVVLDDDSVAIRTLMMVTLTFDHRIIDGMYGCGFLKSLKDTLEAVSP
jgi:2-oxoglutarate dehydrogenase E2 component (dihydrolipoamide succinyltransferase)